MLDVNSVWTYNYYIELRKGTKMKETEKMSADLARVRAELRAKLETAMLMSKLMRMSKE